MAGTGVHPASVTPLAWPTPSPVTRGLAGHLLERADELGVALRDALLSRSSNYASTSLIPADELLRSCRDNMLRSLQSLSGNVPPGVDVRDAAQTTARLRAEAGFPLESLLQAYRIGSEVIWAALLAQAREHAPDVLDELLDSAMQVMELIDLMSVTAADEYRTRELEALRRHTERRQAVLDGLLEGRAADPGFAADARHTLELAHDARLVVVVVRHRQSLSRPPDSPASALDHAGFTSDWRLRADHEVGLVSLGTAPVDRLMDELARTCDGAVAVSQETTSLTDVPSELRLMEMVLSTLPADVSTVSTLQERLPEVLVATNRTVAERLREHALGGLLDLADDKRDVLLETLDRWFQNNRSTADTAHETHCHRNTVAYRLKRIEDLTGARLSDPRDQLLLRLALLAT